MQKQKIQIKRLKIYYEPVVASYAYGQILHYCEDINTNTTTQTQTQTQTQTNTNTNANTK